MGERITAWQCIGCGRIEGAQPCVGICQDRRTDFVYASDHDAVLAQLALERARAEALAVLVRQLAYTTPRKDRLGANLSRAAGACAPDSGDA